MLVARWFVYARATAFGLSETRRVPISADWPVAFRWIQEPPWWLDGAL